MKLLLISELFSGETDTAMRELYFMLSFYGVVLLATLLDLWSGLRKSRKRSVEISSFRLRDTTDKLARYFNLMLIFTLIDIVILEVNGIHLPFMTMLCAIGICVIEGHSIWERVEDKEKARTKDAALAAEQVIEYIAKNKKQVAEILKKSGSPQSSAQTPKPKKQTELVDENDDGGYG